MIPLFWIEITEVLVDVAGPSSQPAFNISFKKPTEAHQVSIDLDTINPLASFASPREVLSPATKDSFSLVRTYNQLLWLNNRLLLNYPLMFIPPFPERPAASTDVDYVEKKRLQMERYLIKVFSRRELEKDADVNNFLSEDMVESGGDSKLLSRSLSSSLLSPKPTSSSVASFFVPILSGLTKRALDSDESSTLAGDIEADLDDAEETGNRERYILTMERAFSRILDSFSMTVKLKEAQAKSLIQLSQTFKDQFGIETFGKQSDRDSIVRFFEEFLNYCTNNRQSRNKQIKEEILKYGDIQLEYKNSIPVLKKIMNGRANLLNRYMTSLKDRSKKRNRLSALMENGSSSSYAYDVSDAEVALKRAEEDVTKSKADFNNSKLAITRELVRFEKDKIQDLNQAMKHYAEIQVKSEQQYLNSTKSLLMELGVALDTLQ